MGSASTWLYTAACFVGGVAALFLVTLYVSQNQILYMPCPPGFPKTPEDNPSDYRSPREYTKHGKLVRFHENEPCIDFEEKYVETSDGEKIHTWLILHENSPPLPTLIYFHGNAGNMGFRLKNAMYMFYKSQVNVLMMDYRGYGSSSGTPTEDGINKDADAVVKYALDHPRLKGSPIVLFGRSLGGAVAISLAARNPAVKAIIIENTFLSIAAMVDKLMPAVAFAKDLILRIKWDCDVKIQRVKVPTLFIAGELDELVPHSHMIKLHELSGSSQKDLFIVKNGSHNDTWEKAGSAYYERIKDFLRKSFASETSKVTETKPIVRTSSPETEDYYKISEVDLEDEDNVHLPTMTTHFTVK